MRMMRPVATVITVGLAAVNGWYVYLYGVADRCTTTAGFAECRDPSDYDGTITLLLLAGIVAVCASGHYSAFVALFFGLGVPVLVVYRDDPFSGGWFTGFTLVVGPLLPLLAIPWFRASERRARRLMAEGSEAIGTVLSVKDSNLTVNHNPGVRIRLRIEPVDGGPAFEAEKVALVSRVTIPRPRDRFPVFFDPADPSDWVFATGPPDETTHPRMRRLWERAKRMSGPTLPPPSETSGDVVANLTTLNEQYLRGDLDADDYAQRSAALLRTATG